MQVTQAWRNKYQMGVGPIWHGVVEVVAKEGHFKHNPERTVKVRCNPPMRRELPVVWMDPLDLEPYGEPSITCPRCKRTSYSPEDIRQGYCGFCNAWTTEREYRT